MSTAAAESPQASLTSRVGVGAGVVAALGPLLGWIAFVFLPIHRGPDSGATDALGSMLCWLARAFARAAELRGVPTGLRCPSPVSGQAGSRSARRSEGELRFFDATPLTGARLRARPSYASVPTGQRFPSPVSGERIPLRSALPGAIGCGGAPERCSSGRRSPPRDGCSSGCSWRSSSASGSSAAPGFSWPGDPSTPARCGATSPRA